MSDTRTNTQNPATRIDDPKVKFTIDELVKKAQSVSDHWCAGTGNSCKG